MAGAGLPGGRRRVVVVVLVLLGLVVLLAVLDDLGVPVPIPTGASQLGPADLTAQDDLRTVAAAQERHREVTGRYAADVTALGFEDSLVTIVGADAEGYCAQVLGFTRTWRVESGQPDVVVAGRC